MTYVWGVAFGKDIGAEKTPHSNSARCVSMFYAFFALVVVNTYCANLMAFLVQENVVLPISGIRDSKVKTTRRIKPKTLIPIVKIARQLALVAYWGSNDGKL